MGLKSKRMESVRQLMRQLENEPSHAKQVTRLALQLFDELKLLHGLKDKEREYLEAASLLHDIGWSEGGRSHHKSSMKLILANDLLGWKEEEKLIIANIARYHRKSLPKEKHSKFAALSHQDKEIVKKLAALLRIADGLDRSHGSYVRKVQCQLGADRVQVTLFCNGELVMELYGFEKKRDLFEYAFGLPIVIKDIRNA